MTDNGKTREQLFLEALQTAKKTARQGGDTISSEQLGEIFAATGLTPEQTAQVRDFLLKSGISVDEAPADEVEPEDALTEEEHDYLKEYEEMIAQIPQPEESVMTAIRISAMAGDKEAQRSLAQYMLPKVLDICRLYAGQGVPAEDLIGAGSEALVRAAALLGPLSSPDEVDGDLTRRIMDAMEDLISDNLLIKAQDAKIAENANLVADKAAELAKTLGRKVTPEELAREGEVTMEQITEAVRATGRTIEDIEYGQEEA